MSTSHDISPDEVRLALREFFTARPGVPESRQALESWDSDGPDPTAFNRDTWRALAADLGLAALGAPTAWGGTELGMGHMVAAMEECGRTLYSGPLQAAGALAVNLYGVDPHVMPDALAELLAACLSGDAVPGINITESTDLPELQGDTFTGRLTAVTHGCEADVVIAVVLTAEGPAIAAVDSRGATSRSPRPLVDAGLGLADIDLREAPAVVLSRSAAGVDAHHTAVRLLSAAEQAGGATACLEAMVAYAGLRQQFDQVIGSFQTIQHRCATLAVDIAGVQGLVAASAAAWDCSNFRQARELSLLARADGSDTFARAADGYIQVSGGIGFTWEHDAHLFFRRSRSSAALGGVPARQRWAAVEAGCLDLLVDPIA